jgi:hypothetical protein
MRDGVAMAGVPIPPLSRVFARKSDAAAMCPSRIRRGYPAGEVATASPL